MDNFKQKFLNCWNGSDDEFSNRDISVLPYLKDSLPFVYDCQDILDCGAGVGNLVRFLKTKSIDAVGISYNKKEVQFAKKYDTNLIYADMHDLPFQDESFDAVIAWDSLEHCLAPLLAVKEIYRVLKPSGRLLIYIPDMSWQDCKYHIIVPTIQQMLHLLEIVGFQNVEYENKGNQSAVYKVIKVIS